MAGTIISTPSLGASDWSDFITQQERTDRGYMRVSLTNFSGTAASSIGTGSVMECAGSIYQFTETAMSLATGTASADVAVYFQVIPTAGGTTCTVVMDSTVPIWIDAKQGFYASAASITRVIGGCYIGTAATYYTKFLYTEENLVYCLQHNETRPILKKVLDMGEWNMDADQSKNVAHNLKLSRIRAVHAAFVDDTEAYTYQMPYVDLTGNNQACSLLVGATNISARIVTGGTFDAVGYNATASTLANRGWITVLYEA